MGFLNKKLRVLTVLLLFITVVGYAQNLVPGGVDAGADVTIDCTSGPCTTLSADFHHSHETNTRYTVSSIPMDPVNVTLPSDLEVDDGYSLITDLDGNTADNFLFCFFGDVYEEVQIGDNGTISFDTTYTPLTAFIADFTLGGNIPSPQPLLPNNSVFGAFHDLLIPAGQELVTYGVTGTAPFRAFVINYRNVPHYNCGGSVTTQQIVLHETSNFIDVYITEKPSDCGWQGGNAAVGIQNIDGSEGYFAPGRNTSDSPWSATDEAWRFAPEESGAETFTFEWINNTTGAVISTDPDFEVCPTETTTYTAHVTWVNCVGGTEEAFDDVTITVDLPFTLAIDGGDQNFCVGDPAYTINTTTTVTGGITIVGYNWYEAADPATSLGTGSSLTVSTTGTYVVEVTDSGGCVLTQQVVINYNPAPEAGTNGAIDFCSTDSTIDLFLSLGGTPDTTGTWSPALTSGTGFFDPAIDTAGVYTYTVAGSGSCPDATATITVGLTIAPIAGTNGSIGFCSTDASVDLYASLGGAPDLGGTWSPALTSGTGIFDPSVDTAGTYTYTVIATGFCSVDASATVTVAVDIAPIAGANGTADFCSTDVSADLYVSLGGTPDAGGTWSPALTSGTGFFDPAVDTAGTYTYIVTGGSCPDATADVVVTVTTAPNAGTDNSISFCTSDATTDLFTSLGTADAGGVWSPALTSGTGDFDPLVDTAGMYTYTVLGVGVCIDDTAVITVTVDTAPNAGTDNSISFCSTDAITDIFLSLGGTPDLGGTWSPALASGTGDFDPAVDVGGMYIYTVMGAGACTDVTATITVAVTAAPNAGVAIVVVDICDTETAFDIIVGLTGQDAGGTWNDDDGTGGLTGSNFDATGLVGTFNFTYTVAPTAPCAVLDTETVQVTVIRSPVSGTAIANLLACNTDAALDLDAGLTGQDAGGTWNDDDVTGSLTANLFDPAGLATGTYNFTYTVTAIAPCVDASTTISVEVTAAPNAGTAVVIADICDTETAFDITVGLTGQDAGGTWNDDDGTGGLTGSDFDAAGLVGTFNFTYTVAPTAPCAVLDTETVQVTVIRSPVSGTAIANLLACNTDAALDLDAGLTGQDAGGTWNDDDVTGSLTANLFDPAGLATGTYNFTYTVTAIAPCVDASTTISVEVTAAPNAGTAVVIADICDTETAFDLSTGLTGQDAGGTWNDDDGTGGLTGSDFDATGLVGTFNFTYTVNPTAPCAVADTETIQVTVIRSPVSGTAIANLLACNTDAAVDLDTGLMGADLGGTWNDDDGTGSLSANLFDVTGLATGTYNFTYTVTATAPCVDASTTISVEVTAAPNAGAAVVIADICDTETAFDITVGLTGQDGGGTWNDDDGTGGLTGSNFDATGLSGTFNFTYTVNPTAPCAVADTETVQVTVIRSPVAGTDGEIFFCMDDATDNLYASLNGTPDLGGIWSPALTSGTGEFNPALDAAGIYTYTVTGSGACADDTATVTVTLSEAPIITSVDVIDFSANNTITVNVEGIVSGTSFGIGDYVYSLDGINFQSENIIQNVAPGTYTVTVRDANGCLPNAYQFNVIVMGAPTFFTPNNDGQNDTWQIVNIQSQPNALINLYDRFGKFITRIDPTSLGWDGYYNGESLPSTDYWFSVSMEDIDGNPVIRRGHFSLVRR